LNFFSVNSVMIMAAISTDFLCTIGPTIALFTALEVSRAFVFQNAAKLVSNQLRFISYDEWCNSDRIHTEFISRPR
jgi:hypothetical protein